MKPFLAYTDHYCSIDDFLMTIAKPNACAADFPLLEGAIASLRLNGQPTAPRMQGRLATSLVQTAARGEEESESLYDVLSRLRGRALISDKIVIDLVDPGLTSWFYILMRWAVHSPNNPDTRRAIEKFFADLYVGDETALDPVVGEIAEALIRTGGWETLDDILMAGTAVVR
jgi:hypothetical protein